MRRIMGHLAQFSSFSKQGELLCTQGLAYLLSERAADAAFCNHMSERAARAVGPDLTWRAEVRQQDGGRPDLEGRTADGKVMVKIEAKLDAEFGEGQLNSYIRDLRSNSSNGLVLVLVPRRRDDVIAEDIIQTVSPEFALTGDGPWRLNKTPDCSIAVIYWEEVLEALGRALSEQNSKYLERPSNRSDRPGKMQENQWPRNPVLTFWQSKRICSDNAAWTVLRPNGVMESAQ